jgi:cytochrome c553
MKRLAVFMLLPSLAWGAAPDGQQIFLHGNGNGALPCAACHGAQAQGNPIIGAPKLAGLPAATITAALAQIATGQSGNAIMQSIARALSPEDVQAVALYVAGLSGK